MSIAYPPVIINEYLSEKIVEALPDKYVGSLRFFPTLPTDFNAMTESFPETATDVFGVYDRMFKLRKGPFPHIKDEQLLYYLYKNNSDPEALIETSQVIHDLLDRQDESAEEINQWVSNHPNFDGTYITFGTGALARTFKPVYFHQFKVYQLEEARDISSFGTMRTYAGSKMIIDYRYHIPKDANNS